MADSGGVSRRHVTSRYSAVSQNLDAAGSVGSVTEIYVWYMAGIWLQRGIRDLYMTGELGIWLQGGGGGAQCDVHWTRSVDVVAFVSSVSHSSLNARSSLWLGQPAGLAGGWSLVGNRTPSPMQFTPLQFAPCNLPYKTLPRYDFCHIRIVPQTTIALCDVCHLRFSPHTPFSLVLPMKTCATHKFFVINRLRILNNPKSVDHKWLS